MIYANNEAKSMPACDLGDYRDNDKIREAYFISLYKYNGSETFTVTYKQYLICGQEKRGNMDYERQQHAPIYEALENVSERRELFPLMCRDIKRGRGNPELVQSCWEKNVWGWMLIL